jgi:hypothetical protein
MKVLDLLIGSNGVDLVGSVTASDRSRSNNLSGSQQSLRDLFFQFIQTP